MEMEMDFEMDPSFIKEVLDLLYEEAEDKEMEVLATVSQPSDEPLPSSNQRQDHHQFDYSLPHYPANAQLKTPLRPLSPVFSTATTTDFSYPYDYYPSFSLLDTTTPIGHFLSGNPTADLTNNNPGIFNGSNNMFLGPDHLPLQAQDVQGESVVTFCHETRHRKNNCRSTPLSPEISSQEDPYKKREYRKEKIAMFMKKRKTLNFSNNTHYLERRKRAQARQRDKGRFVKMDRTTCNISNLHQDKYGESSEMGFAEASTSTMQTVRDDREIKMIEKTLTEDEEEEEAFADSLLNRDSVVDFEEQDSRVSEEPLETCEEIKELYDWKSYESADWEIV